MSEPYRGASAALELPIQSEELDPGLDEPEDLLGLPAVAKSLNRGNAGKGRAKGSQNRRTAEMIAYIGRRYGSPIEILMQMARAPVDKLSQELHCSRLEAYRSKQSAAIAAAPFLHARLASLELLPPGHPGGEPSTLTLVPQCDFADYEMADPVVVEAAPEAVDERSVQAASTSESEASNRDAALLAKSDAAGPSSSTLRLQPQEPIEQALEASAAGADHVDAAVARALDALAELMRGDPEQARHIRARMAAILG
jgi:hypothetical protein